MRIYLASAWSRREEMQHIAWVLKLQGHEITSRWLVNEKDSSTFPADGKASQIDNDAREAKHTVNALHDVEDVLTADAIVRFSDAPEMVWPLVPARLLSGARNFEFGLMYGADLYNQAIEVHGLQVFTKEGHRVTFERKLMFVVDGKQNIFDRLPEVMHVKDVNQLYEIMSRAAELERGE
jgi:hypothetical protein